MGRYFITDPAAADLAQLWQEYVERGGTEASADRLTDKLLSSFQNLADFPDIGTPRDYLTANLLAFPHDDYMIFYQKRSYGVDIARVLYGAMDLKEFFTQH